MRFPDPRDADSDIVAIGGRLDVPTLVEAYRKGIFPWPIEGLPLPWFCPKRRAILEFSRIHVPRSLARASRRSELSFSIDEAFDAVIECCSLVPRPGQEGTWITDDILAAYKSLHRAGFAHSVEAWEGENLVGGLYGVDAAGAFAGESMFFARPNASKLALLHLVEHLKSRGLDWMDIQMMTPHMEALGARIVRRATFLDRLAATQARKLTLFG